MPTSCIKLGIVDDHKLFRESFICLIEKTMGNATNILFDAANGLELKEKLDKNNLPDILLLDINMPGMNGFECVQWLQANYSEIKILVISMIEREESILQMFRMGVKGYLSKDVEPKELNEAIISILHKGYYYTDFVTGNLVHSLQINRESNQNIITHSNLNEREIEFLRYTCSEFTYEQIAAKMFLSPKTIDGYRKALFVKLSVANRVGLAMYAVKYGLVTL